MPLVGSEATIGPLAEGAGSNLRGDGEALYGGVPACDAQCVAIGCEGEGEDRVARGGREGLAERLARGGVPQPYGALISRCGQGFPVGGESGAGTAAGTGSTMSYAASSGSGPDAILSRRPP